MKRLMHCDIDQIHHEVGVAVGRDEGGRDARPPPAVTATTSRGTGHHRSIIGIITVNACKGSRIIALNSAAEAPVQTDRRRHKIATMALYCLEYTRAFEMGAIHGDLMDQCNHTKRFRFFS